VERTGRLTHTAPLQRLGGVAVFLHRDDVVVSGIIAAYRGKGCHARASG
jgi:hypothetical protein